MIDQTTVNPTPIPDAQAALDALMASRPTRATTSKATAPRAIAAPGNGSLQRRMRHYVATIEGVGDGGRNTLLFRTAGNLWSFIDSNTGEIPTEAEVLDGVREVNARCSPPLGDDEVQAVVRSARVNGTPRAPKVGGHHAYPAATPECHDHPAALELGELIDMNPTLSPPVIDGFVRHNEVATVIGASKSRKSWLMLHLAMCVAKGGMTWLGFEAIQGRVLLIDLELAPAIIAARSRRVMESLGLTLADFEGRLKAMPMRGRAFSIDTLEAMQAAGELEGYSLIIVDPLYRCYPKNYDENSNADAAALYARFAQVAAKTGAALVIVHHLPKGIHGDKSTVDLGAGAGAVARAGDVHAAVIPTQGDDNAAELRCSLRSFPRVEPVPVRWSGYHWRVDDHAAEVVRREWTPEAFAEAFTDDTPKGRESVLAAAEGAGMTQREAMAMFSQARDAGFIHEGKQGRRSVFRRQVECARA